MRKRFAKFVAIEHEEEARIQGVPTTPKENTVEVMLADGPSKVITQTVTYDVTFGDKTVPTDFLVMEVAT